LNQVYLLKNYSGSAATYGLSYLPQANPILKLRNMAMMSIVEHISANDGILLLSLAYSSIDIVFEWDNFKGCVQPIHWWLLLSYCFVIVFRMSHLLGNAQAGGESEDFLLNLRQQKTIPKILVKVTWLMLLPIFAVWTVTGSIWFRDVMTYTPECLPMGAHPWFIGFWQALSYLWILVHLVFGGIACVLEKRIRTAEGNLREIEDDDSIARWGRMSNIPGYGKGLNAGLSPADIDQLPIESWSSCEDAECSICLNDIFEGDAVRRLPGCSHTFHKSCIDLWVLRRADCPLCKCKVVASPTNEDHARTVMGMQFLC